MRPKAAIKHQLLLQRLVAKATALPYLPYRTGVPAAACPFSHFTSTFHSLSSSLWPRPRSLLQASAVLMVNA